MFADLQEPHTISKAQCDPHWRKAMQEEYQALLQNHTLMKEKMEVEGFPAKMTVEDFPAKKLF